MRSVLMRKYLGLLLGLFLYSCTEKNGQELLIVQSTPGYFQDKFKPCSVIPIETNDSLLVSDIERVISVDRDYLLLSSKSNIVALLDGTSGKAKAIINRVGTGPGEYRRIIDIAYDSISQRILIYNDYSKLLFYDLNGSFLSDISVEGSYEFIVCRNNEVIFYNALEGYSCQPFMIKKYDLSKGEWINVGNNTDIEFPMRIKGRQIVASNRIWFIAPLDFNMYCLSDDGFSSMYEIGYPKSALSKRLIKSAVENPMDFLQKVGEDEIVYGMNSVRELNDYIIYRTNQMDICLLEKNKRMVHSDKFILQDFFNLSSNDYFPHDGNDNLVMFVLSAEKYAEGLEWLKIYGHDLDNRFVFEDVKEDHNPLLVFFQPIDINK